MSMETSGSVTGSRYIGKWPFSVLQRDVWQDGVTVRGLVPSCKCKTERAVAVGTQPHSTS